MGLAQREAQQLTYKEHTILCRLRSLAAAGFLAVAFVSWGMPDRYRRVMHCFTLPKPYTKAEDACNAAFDEARRWIDYHVEFEL
jgi:hypothetical protein